MCNDFYILHFVDRLSVLPKMMKMFSRVLFKVEASSTGHLLRFNKCLALNTIRSFTFCYACPHIANISFPAILLAKPWPLLFSAFPFAVYELCPHFKIDSFSCYVTASRAVFSNANWTAVRRDLICNVACCWLQFNAICFLFLGIAIFKTTGFFGACSRAEMPESWANESLTKTVSNFEMSQAILWCIFSCSVDVHFGMMVIQISITSNACIIWILIDASFSNDCFRPKWGMMIPKGTLGYPCLDNGRSLVFYFHNPSTIRLLFNFIFAFSNLHNCQIHTLNAFCVCVWTELSVDVC